MKTISALVSHAIATGVVAVVTFVLAAVGYTGLLLWAVLAGEPLGGPFALLAMLLTAVAVVPVIVLLFLLPATAAARALRRLLRWSWWTEMPLAALAMVGLVAIAGTAAALAGHAEFSGEHAQTAGALAGLMLLPLGLYWWTFTAADGVQRLATSAWKLLARCVRTASSPDGRRADAAPR